MNLKTELYNNYLWLKSELNIFYGSETDCIQYLS